MGVLWDYHTHHQRCNHASGDLKDYVEYAIQEDLAEIGLSDHFPMHLMPNRDIVENWAMKAQEVPKYIEECHKLKKKYQDKILIKISSEVDFCTPVFNKYTGLVNPYMDNFDYIIGSVHVLNFGTNKYYPIDGSENPELMEKFGVKQFYNYFFEEMTRMVKTDYFDIVGHCDLPKKYGVQLPDSAWPALINFLQVVKDHDLTIEINTSGFRKKIGEQYPSEQIIRAIVLKEIPITLGSDAHQPEEVGDHFSFIINQLQTISKQENVEIQLAKFNRRQRSLIPLVDLYN